MCTLVILRRPGHAWPLILGANRDEMKDRPWSPPGRHWPDRPEVLAGRDDLAGGSWMGVNDHGVVAAILNRQGTLGPALGKRSRGELVLLALDEADAAGAALVMSELRPDSYRPFNMVVADNRDAFYVAHRADDAPVVVDRLRAGLTMLTSREPDDPSSPRIAFHRPRFLAAPPPDPGADDWAGWEGLLASDARADGTGPEGAMSFALPGGFGTVSSALVGLPAIGRTGVPPVFRFAPGPPDRTAYRKLPWP
ncbi:MAG: NRDE family protein [Alphaproteobacteria bacterium]|nr:NRDE family protein [Alphaproteobacteria bacterium]